MDGVDDFAGGVAAEDEAAGGGVLLHGAAESVLGVLGQLIHLSQNQHCRERGGFKGWREGKIWLNQNGSLTMKAGPEKLKECKLWQLLNGN